MMKLRPKVLESGKGNLGGLGTWVPVVIVVVAVALHMFDVVPAVWAAIPVAAALLYTMAEPVVYRLLREGQFPGWARAAAIVLVLGALAWMGYAVWAWASPGTVVAEGDLLDTEQALPVAPQTPGELRDYVLEVSVAKLPGIKKDISYPYSLRVGSSEVRGHFGKEFVRRRFRGGGGRTLRERAHEIHRLRLALDPKKDKIRLASLVRNAGGENLKPEEVAQAKLEAPIHILLQETPFTRLTLALVSGPLLLLAAVVEAFEDRSRKEKSRLTMLVGGMLAAVIYFLVAVTADNVLMGVLGCALAGLAGAAAAFVVAFLAAKVIPARRA
jgi:hypothetical protein